MGPCRQCGGELRSTSRFCPSCGAPVQGHAGVAGGSRGPNANKPRSKYSLPAQVAMGAGLLFFVPLAFLVAIVMATVALSRVSTGDAAEGDKQAGLVAMALALGSAMFQGIAIWMLAAFGVVDLGIPAHMHPAAHADPQDAENRMRLVAMSLEDLRHMKGAYPKPLQYSEDVPQEVFAEIGRFYTDPYRPSDTGSFRYYSNGKDWYILTSQGPDLDADIDVTQFDNKPDAYPGTMLTYDPSNGAISDGDLWLVGPFEDYEWFLE